MAKSSPNPKVDWYFENAKPWSDEFRALRAIALETGLAEELKWGHPCYTLDGKNVFLMHGFKEYCALLLHKGALLKSGDGLLIQQTSNVQSARQIRFTSVGEIAKQKRSVVKILKEAIEIEKAGLKVELKPTKAFAMPEEFKAKLKAAPALKKAFESLTPGRQRGYLLHFGSAKQSATRTARIEKNVKRILAGLGLED